MPIRSGKIKEYNAERGFGFISPDDGSERVYFHRTKIIVGDPSVGAFVEFETVKGQQGPAADRVQISKARVPPECVFTSFWEKDKNTGEKNLRLEIFFSSAQKAAVFFQAAGLTQSALRMLFQGLRFVVMKLDHETNGFARARESYGAFFSEKIVRQRNRNMLPEEIRSFFEAHNQLILSDPEEMSAFFTYLKSILCYFGDR